MATRMTPTLDPLPKSTSIYHDGHGRLKRLTVVAVPRRELDPDQFGATPHARRVIYRMVRESSRGWRDGLPT
jgi:hypothetical protein